MWPVILGSLGGLVAFVGAVFIVFRVFDRNVVATENNTKAIEKLNQTIPLIGDRVSKLEIWQAVMEDRQKRGR